MTCESIEELRSDTRHWLEVVGAISGTLAFQPGSVAPLDGADHIAALWMCGELLTSHPCAHRDLHSLRAQVKDTLAHGESAAATARREGVFEASLFGAAGVPGAAQRRAIGEGGVRQPQLDPWEGSSHAVELLHQDPRQEVVTLTAHAGTNSRMRATQSAYLQTILWGSGALGLAAGALTLRRGPIAWAYWYSLFPRDRGIVLAAGTRCCEILTEGEERLSRRLEVAAGLEWETCAQLRDGWELSIPVLAS